MNPETAIKNAIGDHGPITFAEFMELALYGPGGYYTSGSPISASGDYFTSPAAHPLFGALIAVQLREMWQLLGTPDQFTVVEEAAGNGCLAADITEYASKLDAEFDQALHYAAFDVSPPDRQHYPVSPLANMPTGVTGCVVSNELLDAMPVHRFELRDGEIQEIFVTHNGQNFSEVLQAPSLPEIEQRLRPFIASLPNGYRGEVNLGLNSWAQRQAKTLARGWTLTIDYGFQRAELYRRDRITGSLRTYYQHTLGQDPLQHAGKQDITAHVDFTAVDEALSAVGFQRSGKTTQAEFLARLGIESAFDQLSRLAISRPVKRANEAGMQALVDPNGMGAFIVDAHGRDFGDTQLSGFGSGEPPKPTQLANVPVLNPQRHINLTGPQQPDAYFEVPSLADLFSDEP